MSRKSVVMIVCLATLSVAQMAMATGGWYLGPFVQDTGNWTTVPNGSFENGLTGWDLEDPHDHGVYLASNEMATDGAYSAKGIASATFPIYGFALRQYVSVVPGQEYVLSGSFSKFYNSHLTLDLDDVAFEVQPYAHVVAPSTWQFAWETFTVPAGVNSVRVRLLFDTNVVLGEYGYFDEVAVTPVNDFSPPSVVPEPATLGLLAMGGLALLRRRKSK